jgi:hypothetical protein
MAEVVPAIVGIEEGTPPKEVFPESVGTETSSVDSWMTRVSSGQLIQQRFGLLQVFGVKSLGEPAVDFG